MTDRETQIAKLIDRLEDGNRRIDEAQRRGEDTYDWETFWIKLLNEYEALCREAEDYAEAREQAMLL